MSIASERKDMREWLPEYALMTLKELAAFLGVTPETAKQKLLAGHLPWVRRGMSAYGIDPLDVMVYMLAEKAGQTMEEYWAEHGDRAVDLAWEYYRRIRRFRSAA